MAPWQGLYTVNLKGYEQWNIHERYVQATLLLLYHHLHHFFVRLYDISQ